MSADMYNLTVAAWNFIYIGTTFVSSLLTGIVSAIGLYVLVRNRKSISKFFNVFVNYSLQNTISELDHKLNALNLYDLNSDSSSTRDEVVCIFSEIIGQIEGNELLNNKFEKEKKNILAYISNSEELTQPIKRYLVTLMREKLKNLNLEVYKELAGEKNE